MTEKTNYPAIKLGSPGEDISKRDLHSIAKRFKNLNQLRLQRVQDFLQARQQIFLDILPLLFHQNHPLLPGFISLDTPIGIPDFSPNKKAVHAAKQFSKTFAYKRKALLNHPIQGIFLMGSVGSVAFSKTSDMDIWLCHDPKLSTNCILELQKKALDIEKWADSLGVEVHFFLINNESFSKGVNIPISSESSGDTQHYLLLEEFYRTAIFIAGRIPAWWLVPPEHEYNYINYLQHLIENRFISATDVIDFGGLETIPAEEFISATLWHIYKSLNSPHKSLLKLFLMESYASEYPKPQWLCFDLKQAIYQGTMNIDKLDPYLLIYAKVEHYLQKNLSNQRLNLARQCFYLKIMGSSSHDLDYKSRLFREDYMLSIAKQWHWPEHLLPSFKKQKFWDIKKANEEHIIVRAQLKHCLRMILKLAGQYVKYNYRENRDLKLLSRKLHVFLERKPGKVEIISTRSAVHTQENELSIVESLADSGSIWALYSGQFDVKKTAKNSFIKQQPSLLEILVWLVANGLYSKHIQLHFSSHSYVISRSELQQILAQIFLFLTHQAKNKSESLEIYNKPNKIISSLLIINLGLSHLAEREDGMMVLSDRSDPLSYGKDRHCFIHNIARISISSWGEVTTYHYLGSDGFFNCINHIFNASQPPLSTDTLKTICFTPTRANSIILRSKAIFENLIHFFSNYTENNNRYFLPADHLTYLFQKTNKQLQYKTLETEDQILQELAKSNDIFSPAYFDDKVFDNPLIPFLYRLNKTQAIQIFYLSENDLINIFIIDEKGSLFSQQHSNASYTQVLNNYLLFLESISDHTFQQTESQLQVYQIKRNSAIDFSAYSENWQTSTNYSDLSIRVIIEEETPSTDYFIYCNDNEFSSVNYGQEIFQKVAQYIHSFRNKNETYPIYISDIDISRSILSENNEEQLQTLHYLNYKKKIENKLNN
ncbi:MAG: class I adenylate cyclase [Methylococcales bacterium]